MGKRNSAISTFPELLLEKFQIFSASNRDVPVYSVNVDHDKNNGFVTVPLAAEYALPGYVVSVVGANSNGANYDLLLLEKSYAEFAVGRFVGHYFCRTIEAGQALGQKNTAFAIWMAYTYLNPLSSVGPGCYILWQNIINSIEIWQNRKAAKK